MQIDILTLFPQGLEAFLTQSILGKAQQKKLIRINLCNLRNFAVPNGRQATDKRKTVDGRPYGGGIGMILRPDIVVGAIESVREKEKSRKKKKTETLPQITNPYVILLDPKGNIFNQKKAERLAKKDWLILVCGHYEGVDARVENFVDETVSIGDYILAGGEAAALVLVDAITRLLPGVLAKTGAKEIESFQEPLLEYPQYTKPANFRGLKVPEVLLTGNQREIIKWRKREALRLTRSQRPDLFEKLKRIRKD
ncbi:tRNA (guanosine(37)-N1)-methyltransferase TrmD [Candidatus Curtissbacteria bacterium RBG_16_39_7]|uniref:tRNA (guanine-N(1)-)-methyltransferase n=1 Tax=Candidatus Curtissbacteria bacterium RBG_16_39_7 TaxID=1797707 RepID=A0A1F5G2T2_9BACT|nr:MAG: tRNA (guanosine(37)-N1)-methyltransferase TrmD [Candidatus Curtissbacteria bacterium RBG_16_39_7]